MIGKLVTVIVDRPLGSTHPKHKDMIYPVNYGFVEGIIAGDLEEQDCYILGIDEPVETFKGKVIAIIKRKNDVEDKWVVSNKSFTKEEIINATFFTEQYFDIEVEI